MAKTLSLSEVNIRLSELVTEVQKREEEVIATKNGHPDAIWGAKQMGWESFLKARRFFWPLDF